MPNWCNNEIQITGDEGELQRFKEFVRDSKAYHGRCTDAFTWVHNPDTGKGESVEIPDACKGGDPFKADCDKKFHEFSFQQIVPMPDELVNTTSPVTIYETQEELDRHLDEIEEKYKGKENNLLHFRSLANQAQTREYSDNLKKMYGADNWYDWAFEQWGTKWDTSETYCEDGGWILKYDFDTAWCPPEPICSVLRDMFPILTINWFFREDGMVMAGYL